jgi:hypothetical protein
MMRDPVDIDLAHYLADRERDRIGDDEDARMDRKLQDREWKQWERSLSENYSRIP